MLKAQNGPPGTCRGSSKSTILKTLIEGFPGGSVVKNPPANEGDTGSIPGLGRSPMLQGSQAHGPQPLSLCSGAQEPHCWAHVSQLLSPYATTTEVCVPWSPCSTTKKPPPWEALTLQLESSPCSPQLEKACAHQWRPQHSQTLNKLIKMFKNPEWAVKTYSSLINSW